MMDETISGSSPNSRNPVIITIDGPAGTGKSSVAHRLASKLGLDFLDTGAMYRATALIALETGIDPDQGDALAAAISDMVVHFDWQSDPPRLMLDDRDISTRIRDLEVSSIVSIVAAQSPVRSVMVEMQRDIAREHPRLVTEGRDQGSVVFPDAAVRFFLDASIEVRAQRRIRQLASAGQSIDEHVVMGDIEARDRLDSSRDDAPLIKPEGAIVIDSSSKSLSEVVEEMERIVRDRLPDAEFTP